MYHVRLNIMESWEDEEYPAHLQGSGNDVEDAVREALYTFDKKHQWYPDVRPGKGKYPVTGVVYDDVTTYVADISCTANAYDPVIDISSWDECVGEW